MRKGKAIFNALFTWLPLRGGSAAMWRWRGQIDKAYPLPEKNSVNFIFSAKMVILAFVKPSPWGEALPRSGGDEGRSPFLIF